MDFRVFLTLLTFFFLLSFLSFSHSAVFPRRANLKITEESYIRLKTRGGLGSGFDPTRVTQLSWHPRAFLHENFLSDEECDHLIHLAKDKLEVSMVADNESGKSIKSKVRTSSGMFLSKNQVQKFVYQMLPSTLSEVDIII
ncbi:Prolyl 4-hydroxylase [Thalictrum thalictroides]|uniref:Prolyl 4-hydroxylase n=1 Tax=Thalictrum thalictroides TaxID=46969 RepID=A0A7J6VZK3_THATH|nr:Prolyl 4-hydroxylase [Thalictrum thalictroides]